MKTIHLVLTHHWYDEISSGRKRIEYRVKSARWMKLIWECREEITHVRFARGYTSTTQTFTVNDIDFGPCPYDGWPGEYIRIHFHNRILTK